MHTLRPRSVVLGIVAALVLAAWSSAQAQMRPSSAELVRVKGRVEILSRGQTTWTAAGARLVEGDQVRAMAGGGADLTLPEGSTILIAENTRFAADSPAPASSSRRASWASTRRDHGQRPVAARLGSSMVTITTCGFGTRGLRSRKCWL